MSRWRILREILGSMKRRKLTRKYCPKCGNPNIGLSSKFDLWLLPELYLCKECGYKGPFVLEMEKMENPTTSPKTDARARSKNC